MIMRVVNAIDFLSVFFLRVSSILILVVIFLLIPEVISRYIFGSSFLFVHDLATFCCGAMYLLGGAYTLQVKGHVNVDIIYNKFLPRTRIILDIITFPIFFSFCAILTIEGSKLFWDSFRVMESTVTPWGGPVWLFKLMLPVGASLLLLQGIAEFIKNIMQLTTKES